MYMLAARYWEPFLTCPEFTTCPPATFADSQIQIADDRVIKVHDVEMSDWNEVIEMFK